nr:hypothetical protein [Ferrimicrobium acidiphilum]
MEEAKVREAIARWLTTKRRGEGWQLRGYKEGKRHGPDLVFERHGHEFIIEAKGDPSKENKHPSSGQEVAFTQALGEIVTRMDRLQASQYGVAFPASYRDKVLRRIPWKAAKTLRLSVFLVTSVEDVEQFTARDLRRHQSKAK